MGNSTKNRDLMLSEGAIADGLQDICDPLWSQTHRCEAAGALCPHVQAGARLSTFPIAHTVLMQLATQTNTESKQCLWGHSHHQAPHSQKHEQQGQLDPVPLAAPD